MRRITSTDLANWAPTRDCQENLPLLIRRLIRASPVTIRKILIPAGDNVILPGYDGTVETVNGTEYIPAGQSVWEMGSGRDFKEKAEKDFKKRSKEVEPLEASEKTFVFVTPHVWSEKDNWIKEREKSGAWKNVRVIDGQILEEWIEQFPNVGIWLAKLLSIPFASAQALDQFWQEWSTTVKYSISTTLVVSDRDTEVKQLTDFFLDTPKLLSVKASTVEETLAFIVATVERLPEDSKEEIYSKAAIIEDEHDFRLVSSYKSSMIFIVKFQAGSLVDQAVRNGHHVIIPIGNDITAKKADIQLPRIRRQGFEKGLEEMGFTNEEAEKLTRDSGQTLSVLRRLLQFEKNQQPDWAKNGNHVDIVPALLAGKWSEDKEEDKSLIGLLAGESYDKYVSKLARWNIEKDPPVFHLKSNWRLTSALDAWSILAPFVTKPDLENFKTAFLSVLPELNPALELDPDKRYLAPLYGKTPKYSYSLKEGLCQSLILIAVFGEEFGLNCINSSQDFADKLVYDLLFEASGDKWCTLHNFLPLLSEASPKSFLRSVEDSLNKENPPIMKMFGDFDLFSSTSYYTGLLWGLENLLIAPEYLLQATLILAKLARLDPGGKLSNRPINTLRATYIPWYGQTRADFSAKKYALQRLAEKEPEIAWKLFLSISPQDHSVVSPIHQCKWRFDTQHLERTPTWEQVGDFNSFVFNQLLSLAERSEEKIAQLIDFFPNISFEDRQKLIEFLKKCKDSIEHKQNLIWDELRKLLAQHREHSEQSWALPSEELDKIEEVFNLYKPLTTIEKHKYLFEEGWIDFPEGVKRREMSHEEREELFDEKRTQAANELYKEKGLESILEMVNGLTTVHHLSHTVAKMNLRKDEEKRLFSLLTSDSKNKQSLFVQNYLFAKAISFGSEWVDSAFAVLRTIHSDPEVIATFFLSLPQKRETWQLIEGAGDEVSKIYWRNVRAYLYHEKLEDKLYAIEKLQQVNRHLTIVDEIAHRAQDISSEKLYDILLKAATIPSEENRRLDRYDVGKIFKEFYERNDIDKEKLAQLEWTYLPFLADRYSNQKPQNLLRELTSNPEFAVQVVSFVYLPDDGKIEEGLSEEELTKKFKQADGARNLLDSWREIPGLKENGSIDKKELLDWITKAREKAKEVNRLYGTDSLIGSVLARYPRNKTAWPPDEICEIIDSLNSEAVLSHFRTEIFNSRGTYVKAAYEGGNQERNLAQYFREMGNRILSKYPRTGSVLLELAKGYERDAKDEDDRAQWDELR